MLNNEQLRAEYTSRINQVIDYINSHLDEELSLEKLAQVAHFSPFHFHRIFGAMVGETLNQFINRLRLQKAATCLIQNPNKSITEIAFDCGFSSSATFARAFKQMFGKSAGEYKNSKIRKAQSKIDQSDSKLRKAFKVSSMYIDPVTNKQTWRIQTMQENGSLSTDVQVKELPDMHVAYIRHIGPYMGDEQLFDRLWNKLCTWAGARDLLTRQNVQFLSVYRDNPEITEADKLRLDVCLTIPEDTKVDGEVNKTKIPGGKYAVAKFEIDPSQYGEAWGAVYGGWLPESGYQPADGPSFEHYLMDPKEHPEGKHVFEICIPVIPL